MFIISSQKRFHYSSILICLKRGGAKRLEQKVYSYITTFDQNIYVCYLTYNLCTIKSFALDVIIL